jgi:hypothetical protein
MTKRTKKTPKKAEVSALVKLAHSVADPLLIAIQTVLDEPEVATKVGNTLALYDTGVEFDSEKLASEALQFILKGFAGSLCYNIQEGYKRGHQKLAEAEDEMIKASFRDENSPSERSAELLHGRIEWCAKMDVQQVYRKAMEQFALGIYTAMTGERYQSSTRSSGKSGVDSPEQNVVATLRARKEARRISALSEDVLNSDIATAAAEQMKAEANS